MQNGRPTCSWMLDKKKEYKKILYRKARIIRKKDRHPFQRKYLMKWSSKLVLLFCRVTKKKKIISNDLACLSPHLDIYHDILIEIIKVFKWFNRQIETNSLSSNQRNLSKKKFCFRLIFKLYYEIICSGWLYHVIFCTFIWLNFFEAYKNPKSHKTIVKR